jgi:hypothetical protein
VSIYGFRPGPSFRGASRAEMFDSALNQPMNMGATFWDQAKGGTLESFGLGTAIRGADIPAGDTSQLDTGEQVKRTFETVLPGGIAGAIGSTIRRLTDEPSKSLDENAWKASAYYRKDVPWDAAMTEDRAAALAAYHDAKKVREYYAQKRPFTSFVGNLAGQAVDPINYIPVAGPVVEAAAVARAGRVLGRTLTGAGDAAANTAIAGLATREQRGRYGDDVSWQATISEIATAALIGSAFGTISGAIGARRDARIEAQASERLSTLRTTQEARIALNEAIDGVVRGEDVSLSPNGMAGVERVINETRAEQLARLARTDAPVDAAPLRPVNLMQFLAGEGGIVDEAGALRSMGLSRKFIPGSGALVRRNGLSIEYAREAAAEAGYFDHIYGPDEAVAKSTPDDLLRLLSDEAAGRATYSPRLDGGRMFDQAEFDAQLRNSEEYKRVLDEVDTALDELKIDHRVDDDTIRRAAGYMADGDDRVTALERAIEEDYRQFYDAMSERDGGFANDAADIPFFEDAGTPATGGRLFEPQGRRRGQGRRGANAADRRQYARAGEDQRAAIDTSVGRPEPIPEGRAEAERSIAKTEDYKALSSQYRVDPETGDFLESAEIDQLKAEGRLTQDDIDALDQAQSNLENGAAYGEALRAAVNCII